MFLQEIYKINVEGKEKKRTHHKDKPAYVCSIGKCLPEYQVIWNCKCG